MAHHWTQKILFYQEVSGSSTENYRILFPSTTFKTLFLIYHPPSCSCVSEGGRPTAGDFCTHCQPQLPQRQLQHRKPPEWMWFAGKNAHKYFDTRSKTSPILTDPQGMTPVAFATNIPKIGRTRKISSWSDQGSCWGAALVLQTSILWSRRVTNLDVNPDSGIQQWSDCKGCVDQSLSHLNYLVLSVTKIFVGFEQGKNHTEDENQQKL